MRTVRVDEVEVHVSPRGEARVTFNRDGTFILNDGWTGWSGRYRRTADGFIVDPEVSTNFGPSGLRNEHMAVKTAVLALTGLDHTQDPSRTGPLTPEPTPVEARPHHGPLTLTTERYRLLLT
ncbi:hypothetical protein [Kineococcus sp. NUM-3379]